jgi:hypothetical protein
LTFDKGMPASDRRSCVARSGLASGSRNQTMAYLEPNLVVMRNVKV